MRARLQVRTTRRAKERIRAALRAHPLFSLILDPSWYIARYRDVFWAGADAREHLLGPGLDEGRDPGPLVDLSFLGTERSGPSIDGAEILLEFLDEGIHKGRRPSPYVDLRWYAASRGDVSPEPVEALRHLVEVGLHDGADPSPFLSLSSYSARIPDIAATGLSAFAYFTALGQHLGHFPHPAWEEAAYLDTNEYVRFALGMGKHLNGFEHFCAVGHSEVARGALVLPVRIDGRLEEYSEERYLEANPDVARLVEQRGVPDGVTHFFATGHSEIASGSRSLARRTPSARLIPSSSTNAMVENSPAGVDLMLLVHHDVGGVMDTHVLAAIDAYRAAGFDVEVVSSGIDTSSQAELTQRNVPIHLRSTNDDLRDFGAWSLLLDHLGKDRWGAYGRVVLANDSAYFPVRDPAPFLAAMRSSVADIWAATDSFSGGRYHLQSYFLAIRPDALETIGAELARRIAAHPWPTKLGLIQWFEIGISQFAASAGLSLEAYASVAGLTDPAPLMSPPDPRPLSHLTATVTNLTHHFWRHTLRHELPFLKVELLRDNPLGVDIEGWQTEVSGSCSAEIIEAHLARVRR